MTCPVPRAACCMSCRVNSFPSLPSSVELVPPDRPLLGLVPDPMSLEHLSFINSPPPDMAPSRTMYTGLLGVPQRLRRLLGHYNALYACTSSLVPLPMSSIAG